jgi:hypothetical protein
MILDVNVFLVYILDHHAYLGLIALLMTEKGALSRNSCDSWFRDSIRALPLARYLLWKIGTLSELEDRTSLFWSLPALDRCTSEILRKAKQIGIENDEETQTLLSKLYSYRTKIGLEQAKKKHGSTRRAR